METVYTVLLMVSVVAIFIKLIFFKALTGTIKLVFALFVKVVFPVIVILFFYSNLS